MKSVAAYFLAIRQFGLTPITQLCLHFSKHNPTKFRISRSFHFTFRMTRDRPDISQKSPLSHLKRLENEVAQWNRFWQCTVDSLTKVTRCPSILVVDAETQRASVGQLINEVCHVALHPQDSSAYRCLSTRLQQSEEELAQLRIANRSLHVKLGRRANAHKSELSTISKRIDHFQSFVTEIHTAHPAIDHESQPLKRSSQSRANFSHLEFDAALSNPRIDELIAHCTKNQSKWRLSCYERAVRATQQRADMSADNRSASPRASRMSPNRNRPRTPQHGCSRAAASEPICADVQCQTKLTCDISFADKPGESVT